MVGTTGRVREYGRVERLWPESTVVCLASGPSLTREDVAYVRGKARVIVINTSLLLAPWADAFHASDARVRQWHATEVQRFQGRKFSMEFLETDLDDVTVLKNGGIYGLSTDPTTLRNGRNSGYQAVNLAVLLGAARIILLGYDMGLAPDGRKHWHPLHPGHTVNPAEDTTRYAMFRQVFESIVAPLEALGVEVLNCSRHSALTCFPRPALEAVL